MMIDDLMHWLHAGDRIEVKTEQLSLRGQFEDACGEFLVIRTVRGHRQLIRQDTIELVTVCNAAPCPAPETAASETAEQVAAPEAARTEPAKLPLKENGDYDFKPGDRIPLSLIESSPRKPRFKPGRPMNSSDKQSITQIIDDLEDDEDPDDIPEEDTLVVRARGIIKKRDNIKKFGFIEAYDEEKTNYWFPFNALTDEDLTFQDEVIFLKSTNERGHVALGVARPDTIHRLLLLVDYISEHRYYNFPVTIPLLEAILEQYPNNRNVQKKLEELSERRDSYNNRKRL